MKHLIAGILILTMTLALCLGAVALLNHRASQPLQELRLAQRAIAEENMPNAAACAHNAQSLWKQHDSFYGVVLPQRQIEEIDRHFARLLAAADVQDQDEFRITCDELIFLIDHLPNMERGHYANVL